MITVLVFNPGSNSLKFEVIELAETQRIASKATKLASAALDEIGKAPKLRYTAAGKLFRKKRSTQRT